MELYFPLLLEAMDHHNIGFNFDPIAIPLGGVPGQDYPILAAVPDTGFSCAAQQYPGYFADTAPESRCQVFHICQADDRQDSFLCPNGTVFSQQYLVCDWWYSVECTASRKFEEREIILVPPPKSEGVAGSLSGGNGVAIKGDGAIIRLPQDAFPPSKTPHTHQQTHHALPTSTVTSIHHSISPTTFTLGQQLSHLSPPKTTFSQSQQSSHRVHQQPSVSQSHRSAHQSIAHHSVPHSHDSGHHSIPQYTITQSPQTTNHVLPHHLVTPSHHLTLQSSPPPIVTTHTKQSTSQDLAQSTIIQNHHTTNPSLSQSIVTQHSPVQTLFRDDIPPSLLLQPHPSSERDTPHHQSPLNSRPGNQPSTANTNRDTYSISILSQDDKSRTPSPPLREHPNSFTTSHQIKGNPLGSFGESINGLSYSQESEHFLTSVPEPGDDERVEYDNVYSATLFPPNIPQLGDVYEAVKGKVIVDVVKESNSVTSFPSSSIPVQRSTPLHVSKIIHNVKESLEYIQPVSSSRIQDLLTHLPTTDKSLPSVSSSVEDTIIPSPQDNSVVSLPPHQESSIGHFTMKPTFTTPHDSLPQRHQSLLPHHVWRPSQDPFDPSLDTSLLSDASLNIIDSNSPSPPTFIVTPESLHGSSSHPASHQSFKVIHETPPSEHDFVTPHHVLFPSKQENTQNSPKHHSVSYELFEASDHSLPNSRESFLVIQETSPTVHDPSGPGSHTLFHANDFDSRKPSSGIHTAFEALDHSQESFAVIRESFLTVNDASLPHQPFPSQPHHRSHLNSFETPHHFT